MKQFHLKLVIKAEDESEGEGNLITIIMISFQLKNSLDGLDAVLVQMIQKETGIKYIFL